VRQAEVVLGDTSDDPKTVRHLRFGYIAIYAASFGIAMCGTLLHFFGAPVTHVVPYFATAAALIFGFRPRAHRDKLA
jgi:hypothetical protein